MYTRYAIIFISSISYIGGIASFMGPNRLYTPSIASKLAGARALDFSFTRTQKPITDLDRDLKGYEPFLGLKATNELLGLLQEAKRDLNERILQLANDDALSTGPEYSDFAEEESILREQRDSCDRWILKLLARKAQLERLAAQETYRLEEEPISELDSFPEVPPSTGIAFPEVGLTTEAAQKIYQDIQKTYAEIAALQQQRKSRPQERGRTSQESYLATPD